MSKPMRNLPGLRPNSSWYGLEGGGATKRSPGIAPATTSKMAAASRTERVSTCSQTLPRNPPLRAGPSEMRPRDGLRPTRPQQLAGIRMEPVPSLPCATATIPEVTAAAEPPLDPPAVRAVSNGLRVGPNPAGFVIGLAANSGKLVLPRNTKPADRNF